MPIFVPHAKLAALLGEQVIESNATSMNNLLQEIESRVDPKDWEWARRSAILVNGHNMQMLDGLDTKLEPDDQVWMIVPSGGG